MGTNKLILCLLVLMLMFTSLFAQYTEAPAVMVADTVITGTSGTIDFYFNRFNDPSFPSTFTDEIDLNFYYTQAAPVTNPDSAVCDMWGIMRKFKGENYETFYVDSLRVNIFTVPNRLHIALLDTLTLGLPLYDGIRIKIRNSGNDPDTLYTFTNLRFTR